MKFEISFNEKSFDDQLLLCNDESIVAKNSGNFVLYFGKFTFGLLMDKESKRVRNFVGYSSDFLPTEFIEIPKAKKGAIYADEIPDGDGCYYSEEYGFLAKGCYNNKIGWYRVGDEYLDGEVVEIATNTLVNIKNGRIVAIYFKPQK